MSALVLCVAMCANQMKSDAWYQYLRDLLWQRANLPAPLLPLLAPAAVATAVIIVVVVICA